MASGTRTRLHRPAATADPVAQRHHFGASRVLAQGVRTCVMTASKLRVGGDVSINRTSLTSSETIPAWTTVAVTAAGLNLFA